ncbi:hypothetical protein JQN58_38310 [Aneurinibacillus sp. BA2021]|nr:hypothetical protein [Aneurinibacillus sp. BA2021]
MRSGSVVLSLSDDRVLLLLSRIATAARAMRVTVRGQRGRHGAIREVDRGEHSATSPSRHRGVMTARRRGLHR